MLLATPVVRQPLLYNTYSMAAAGIYLILAWTGTAPIIGSRSLTTQHSVVSVSVTSCSAQWIVLSSVTYGFPCL